MVLLHLVMSNVRQMTPKICKESFVLRYTVTYYYIEMCRYRSHFCQYTSYLAREITPSSAHLAYVEGCILLLFFVNQYNNGCIVIFCRSSKYFFNLKASVVHARWLTIVSKHLKNGCWVMKMGLVNRSSPLER